MADGTSMLTIGSGRYINVVASLAYAYNGRPYYCKLKCYVLEKSGLPAKRTL